MQNAGKVALYGFYLTCALLLFLSLYVHYLPIVYGDKLFALYYAREWIDGKQLYSDIFPVSPPLIFWLYALPAALAEYLPGVGDLHALFWAGLSVVGASLVTCLYLIRHHPMFTTTAKQTQFALLFCFIFIFRTYPQYFLDREHLFILLIFPYLLRCLPSLRNITLPLPLRIAIGVLAAIGFGIKPYCLLVFAGLQLLCIISDSSLRIARSLENCIIYAMLLSYCLITWLFYPDYFAITLPMALATYSAVCDESPLWLGVENTVYILIPTFLMFRPQQNSGYRRDIYFLCALCPFFLLYALANNNWFYTYYPLGSFALVITGFVMWEFTGRLRESRSAWLGLACCVGVFLFKIYISLSLFQFMIERSCPDSIACDGNIPLMKEVLREGHPAASFGSISINYTRWIEVSRYSGAPWQTRFYQLWMLPELLLADDAFLHEHQWIITYVGKAFAQDMEQRKPEIMFVDDNTIFYTAHKYVDLIAYFSVVPEFQHAWKQYRYLHSVDMCGPPGSPGQRYKIQCRFDVYKRVTGNGN